MFAPVGKDGWPTRVRLPAFTLSDDALEKAKARTAQLLRPRTAVSETTVEPPVPTPDLAQPPCEAEQQQEDGHAPEAASCAVEEPTPNGEEEEPTIADDEVNKDEAPAAEAPCTEPTANAAAAAAVVVVEDGAPASASHPPAPQTSPPTEPLFLRLYDDAKRIETRHQARREAHRRESRTAEREVCTFNPVLSPRTRRERKQQQQKQPQEQRTPGLTTPARKRPADSAAEERGTVSGATVLRHGDGTTTTSPSPSPATSPRKGSGADRRQPDERDPSQFVFERLYDEAGRRTESLSKKRAASLKVVEDEKGEACTFHPQISPHARRSHKYENFDDFLGAQEEHRLIHQNQMRRLEEQVRGAETQQAPLVVKGLVASPSSLPHPTGHQNGSGSRNGASPRASTASAGNPVAMKLRIALDKDPDYKGPVTGWQERADRYWRTRRGDQGGDASQPPDHAGHTSPRARGRRSGTASASPGRAGRKADGAVYTRLYNEHSQREAERQCVALAQLEKEHAELFKPRLNGTEAFTVRRGQSSRSAGRTPDTRASPDQPADNHASSDSVDKKNGNETPSNRRASHHLETSGNIFDDLYESGVALHKKRQAQQLSEEAARVAGCSFSPRVNPESEKILIGLAVRMARDGGGGNGGAGAQEEDQGGATATDKETTAPVAAEAAAPVPPPKTADGAKAKTPRSTASMGASAPQLHLLRLAQYRKQSATASATAASTAHKGTTSPGKSPGRRQASLSAGSRAASKANLNTSGTASDDFLARNAELLHRRASHVAALQRAEDADDVASCTFRPTLAPLTELMADEQQRYLQIVDSPESRGGSWQRMPASLSPSRSPRARSGANLRPSTTTSPRAQRTNAATAVATAAQQLAQTGIARSPSAVAHVDPTTTTAASPASTTPPPPPLPATAAAAASHRPRVIPIAVPLPHTTGSGRRHSSVRSTRSHSSAGAGGSGSRDETPLRRSRDPPYPQHTPLQALAKGAMPVTVNERDGWVRAGTDVNEEDKKGARASAVPTSAGDAPLSQDYLAQLEAELNATLERWSGMA